MKRIASSRLDRRRFIASGAALVVSFRLADGAAARNGDAQSKKAQPKPVEPPGQTKQPEKAEPPGQAKKHAGG